MKTLYFLFEKIPNPQSGGLITMYRRLEKLLSDTYNIKIISIFDCPKEYKEQFQSECVVIHHTDIDNRFLNIFKYLKNGEIKKFFGCIKSIMKYFLYIPYTRKKLNEIIREKDITLVSCPAAGVFMTPKRKFILEIHSKYDFFWNGSISSKLQIKLMARPSIVIFRNKTDAQKGNRHFPSLYVYNFFDDSQIKRNLNYNKKKNRFIFIGRLNEDKDPIRLLNILDKCINKNKSIKVDIYGNGPLHEEISQYIKAHRLEKNVFLKGYIDDKNVYADYAALLMTSRREGFPLTMIEAKANGIPVISTKWGDAVLETIRHGVDGYIAGNDQDFIKYMLSISDDENLLETLSQNSYQDFDRFRCEKAKKDYIEIIDSLNV